MDVRHYFPTASILYRFGFLKVGSFKDSEISSLSILFLVATDILKPDTGYLSVIERPTAQSSYRGTPERTSSSGSHSLQNIYTEPISEGEEDDNDQLLPAKDERKRMGLSGTEVEEAIAYREDMLKEQGRGKDVVRGQEAYNRETFNTGADNTREQKWSANGSSQADSLTNEALSINPLTPASVFDETFKSKLSNVREVKRTRAAETASNADLDNNEEGYGSTPADDRVISRDWRAPVGKRISVPVRIEPKVYFAAERTFLVWISLHSLPSANGDGQKWLNNAVFVGTIATTLLNFIPPNDQGGLISAAFFTFAALLSIAYAAGIFLYRSKRLKARRASGLYYDKYGPTALCAVLLLALATNIGLRVSDIL